MKNLKEWAGDVIDQTLGKITQQNPNTKEENKYLNLIVDQQKRAETAKTEIDTTWDNEYLMFSGDQWSTTLAYRAKAARQIRPNSVDNFIMPAITNAHAALTGNTPESVIEPEDNNNEPDVALATKLTQVSAAIKYKNKFTALWKKLTLDFIQHGPIIGAVLWDPDWTGGTGPNRWIGEVRLLQIKRGEFYPDPAILDLEERIQDCSYINRKLRRKLAYFKERWPEKGQFVDTDEDTSDDEGQEHGQATLIEQWHRGKPKWIPEDVKQELLQKAEWAMLNVLANPDPFKAAKYKAMAAGEVEGIHVAYATNYVFLEYKPYVYDDGLYPFVYKVLYYDEKSPWGFGETRNVMTPQIMHNKADEIEIEAMSKEGLGGAYYNKGSISGGQRTKIEAGNAKGGALFEVNDINGIKDRTGAKIPASVTRYKEHKQQMVETISQNTPIQQGMKPGGVTAYSAIAELGARSDTRTKGKAEILEDFLIEMEHLIISRVGQFYQETRTFGYRDNDNNRISGTFSNREMMREWERDPAQIDEQGNEMQPPQVETYVPEFYPRVKVVDERPTQRKYYEDMSMVLFDKKIYDTEDLLFVLEEGKFVPKETVLKKLQQRDEQAQLMQQMLQKINQLEGTMKGGGLQQPLTPGEEQLA